VPPPVPDLRTQNLTITGFSILNRARKAPPKALSLIQGVLALTQDGRASRPCRVHAVDAGCSG
jgi:hypothetical protein